MIACVGRSVLVFCGWLVILSSFAPIAEGAYAPAIRRGPADLPRIALTFDDNFYEQRSLAILDVLERHDVPATVFVVGSYVTVHPRITRALASGGFEIADHTTSHLDVSAIPYALVQSQIGGGVAAYRRATGGRTAPFFRPPYGATSSSAARIAGEKGFLYQVLWDVDTNDWRGRSAAEIRDHVLRNARSGSIVLMHLSAPHTAEALPGIITGLRARGYELVTVSGLLKGDRRFFDVSEGGEGGEAILRMVDEGILHGYNADWFGPYDDMTRAQFAKVAVGSAGLHTVPIDVSGTAFVDVPAEPDPSGAVRPFPYDYVHEAVRAGIVRGGVDELGRPIFRPHDDVTRLELAQMLARMVRNLKGYRVPPVDAPRSFPFSDVPTYAAHDVALVADLGLLKGYADGTLRAWATAKRAHVAMVVDRYLVLPDAPSYVADETETPTSATTALSTPTTAAATTTPTASPTDPPATIATAPSTTTTTVAIAPVSTAPATTGTTGPVPPAPADPASTR